MDCDLNFEIKRAHPIPQSTEFSVKYEAKSGELFGIGCKNELNLELFDSGEQYDLNVGGEMAEDYTKSMSIKCSAPPLHPRCESYDSGLLYLFARRRCNNPIIDANLSNVDTFECQISVDDNQKKLFVCFRHYFELNLPAEQQTAKGQLDCLFSYFAVAGETTTVTYYQYSSFDIKNSGDLVYVSTKLIDPVQLSMKSLTIS